MEKMEIYPKIILTKAYITRSIIEILFFPIIAFFVIFIIDPNGFFLFIRYPNDFLIHSGYIGMINTTLYLYVTIIILSFFSYLIPFFYLKKKLMIFIIDNNSITFKAPGFKKTIRWINFRGFKKNNTLSFFLSYFKKDFMYLPEYFDFQDLNNKVEFFKKQSNIL